MTAQNGFELHPGYLDAAAQRALTAAVLRILAAAPLYTPHMPRTGKPLTAQMTNCGVLGWYTDKADGYRYLDRHPETGAAWPPMPAELLDIWNTLGGYRAPPEACLVNWYDAHAGVGQHIDQDEDAPDAPVVSISLGDTAVFRLGGPTRKHPTRTMKLHSGDVVVLGGESRHWYHGVDRILAGSSRLLPAAGFAPGGRFNLTLRRVTRPS